MAIWIEIHCDVRWGGPCEPGRLEPFCATNNGDNPGALSSNPLARVHRALTNIKADAIERGWKKTKEGWVCPGCQKKPPMEAER